jgi:hypothetical protein
MWNKQEETLELLGEVGTLEYLPLSKCYALKQYIGKVNLPTIPADFAYLIFSSDNILKVGKLIIYFEKTELMANLTLEYQSYISEKALTTTSFNKLYVGIKEDLKYLKSLHKEYIDYAEKIIKEMSASKPNQQSSNMNGFNVAKKSIEDLFKNKEGDNNEN